MDFIQSYGRIVWKDNMPALQVINVKSQKFLFIAEQAINLYKNRNNYIRIKHTSQEDSSYKPDYQGEIWGIMEECTADDAPYYTISLYIGEPTGKLCLDKDNKVKGFIERRKYYFAKNEIIRYIKSIEAMYNQASKFTALMMDTEVINFSV